MLKSAHYLLNILNAAPEIILNNLTNHPLNLWRLTMSNYEWAALNENLLLLCEEENEQSFEMDYEEEG